MSDVPEHLRREPDLAFLDEDFERAACRRLIWSILEIPICIAGVAVIVMLLTELAVLVMEMAEAVRTQATLED